ncbi:MAG: hypothetical protein QOF61_585 [Acidobacteriota bacterium]|jgi:hypothetical protein|nr:hypothetical protein [Acidobacteriota bacterium]
MMGTIKLVFGSLGILVFAGVGVISLVRPDAVRNFCVENYRQALSSVKDVDLSFLLKVVPGTRVFRIYGLVSLATAAVIAYALFRS